MIESDELHETMMRLKDVVEQWKPKEPMNSVQHTIREILTYLKVNRNIGHTTAVIRGAQNVDKAILVCANEIHANTMKKRCPASIETVGLGAVENYALRGKSRPLVFDNHTIASLLRMCSNKIEQLQAQVNASQQTRQQLLDSLTIPELAKQIISREKARNMDDKATATKLLDLLEL